MTRSPQHAREAIQAILRDLTDREARVQRDMQRTDQPLVADFDDQAIQRENDEVLERIEESTLSQIRQARHALDRLDRGLFGTCEECGFGIEPARLERIPCATTCASCASVAERPRTARLGRA